MNEQEVFDRAKGQVQQSGDLHGRASRAASEQSTGVDWVDGAKAAADGMLPSSSAGQGKMSGALGHLDPVFTQLALNFARGQDIGRAIHQLEQILGRELTEQEIQELRDIEQEAFDKAEDGETLPGSPGSPGSTPGDGGGGEGGGAGEEDPPGSPGGGGGGLGGGNGAFDFPPVSPLILDLDGDGIELTAYNEHPALFDLDADGDVELTGWVGADDGILAVDLNADGKINNINEVFGNATTDGFIELAAYDTNGDHVINASDSGFSQLLVWQDSGNGLTEAGELKSLTEWGITSIDLDYTAVSETIAGHNISSRSTFSYAGGSTGEIVDAWFTHSPVFTWDYLFDTTYNPTVMVLPNIRGYGDVKDLWIAAEDDSSLLTVLQQLVAQDFSDLQYSSFRSDVQSLVLQWIGVDGVNPESRGPNVDAQHLEGLEKLLKRDFSQYGDPDPASNAGSVLEEIWDQIVDHVASSILVQIPLLPQAEELVAAIDVAQTAENSGTPLTSSEIEALFEQASENALAAYEAHPLTGIVGVMRYSMADYMVGDFFLFIAAIEHNEPISSGDKQTYWQDLLPLINAVANSQNMDDAAYVDALTGTYLDTLTPGDLSTLRSGQVLIGTGGSDTISGTLSDDYIVGGTGDDRLEGNVGHDTYAYYLGDGDDTIKDTAWNEDKLLLGVGISQNDLSFSRVGADDLLISIAGGGSIHIERQFNSGDDEIERVQFSDGSTITAEDIRQYLLASTGGDDTIVGFNLDDVIDANAGNDYVDGKNGADNIIGDPGNDTLIGGSGNDTINGGSDDDLIYGDVGNDSLSGTSGFDTLHGGGGWDTLDGGTGNDALYGDAQDDSLKGGDGDDYLSGGVGLDTLSGGTGADTLDGGDDNDFLDGNTNNDSLTGGKGNDTLQGTAGNDTLNGGDDQDSLLGGTGTDLIHGDAGNDYLHGDDGGDDLYGDAGNDTLIGGNEKDDMWGGTGVDVFKFLALSNSLSANPDRIYDFEDGTDKISVSGLGFTGIQAGAASGSVLGYTQSSGKTYISDTGTFQIIIQDDTITLNNADFIF
jgi:Ca2+-binding RTX toxin-like protein